MAAHTQALVNESKRLARLQSQRVKLRGQLRQVEKEIKFSKKQIKALSSALDPSNPDDQLPPKWKGKVE